MGALRIAQRRQALAVSAGGRVRGVEKLDVRPADGASRGGQRGARHGAFELSNVARPMIAGQLVQGVLGERLAVDRQSVGGAVPRQQAMGQRGNIGRTLAQRREPDRERVDPVVEILTESLVPHVVIQRPVRRRDQAEVGFDGAMAPETLVAVLFEHPQQLGLRHEREVPDFVEEQRAVVCQLQPARLAIVSARKRPLFVAEDLGLEERVGQRRAVERLEVAGATATKLVNHSGDDFLAGAGGTQDEHGDVRLSRGADPFEHDEHLLVASDHFPEPLHRRQLILVADGGSLLEERVEQAEHVAALRTTARVAQRRAAPGGAPRRSPPLPGGSSRCPAACGRTSA